MARVKQILSERRHAILDAAKILRARGNAEAADALLKDGEKFDGELADQEISK